MLPLHHCCARARSNHNSGANTSSHKFCGATAKSEFYIREKTKSAPQSTNAFYYLNVTVIIGATK
jgi:hypothetical protein